MNNRPISAGDRAQLERLITRRTKFAKQQITVREMELRAQLEEELSTEFDIDDETWTAAVEDARRAIEVANRQIDKVCEARGIRREFRPGIEVKFFQRGSNVLAARRAEVRAAGQSAIKASAERARWAIESAALEAYEALARGTLASDMAVELLDQLPSPQSLMPPVRLAEIDDSEASVGSSVRELQIDRYY